MIMSGDEYGRLLAANIGKTHEKVISEIDNLLRKNEELEAEARAAADAGDTNEYLRLIDRMNKNATMIFVKRNWLQGVNK